MGPEGRPGSVTECLTCPRGGGISDLGTWASESHWLRSVCFTDRDELKTTPCARPKRRKRKPTQSSGESPRQCGLIGQPGRHKCREDARRSSVRTWRMQGPCLPASRLPPQSGQASRSAARSAGRLPPGSRSGAEQQVGPRLWLQPVALAAARRLPGGCRQVREASNLCRPAPCLQCSCSSRQP